MRLIDRKKKPLDLTTATGVLMYARNWQETTNDVDGESCQVQGADTGEEYSQRVKGPDTQLSAGRYAAYFKVLYGPAEERIPSDDYYTLDIEPSYE